MDPMAGLATEVILAGSKGVLRHPGVGMVSRVSSYTVVASHAVRFGVAGVAVGPFPLGGHRVVSKKVGVMDRERVIPLRLQLSARIGLNDLAAWGGEVARGALYADHPFAMAVDTSVHSGVVVPDGQLFPRYVRMTIEAGSSRLEMDAVGEANMGRRDAHRLSDCAICGRVDVPVASGAVLERGRLVFVPNPFLVAEFANVMTRDEAVGGRVRFFHVFVAKVAIETLAFDPPSLVFFANVVVVVEN